VPVRVVGDRKRRADVTGDAALRVRPKYLAIGSDWARKNYYEQIGVSQDWLDEQNITLVYVPRFPGISTTELRSL
jgi:hypothetical protein